MPVNPPHWWYPERDTGASVVPWLLAPASALYGVIAGHHMTRAPTHVSALPVICIGNFTAGGTGKTPLALDIAARVKALGRKPAFLTRGYGGTLPGPYDVDPARDLADRTGDEALLLARAAPTVIATDRARGARQIERTSADVIIMDDGMQNPGVAKNLTIALIDGARGIGNGRCIPAGPLRAPIERQAACVDAIVINGALTTPLPASLTSGSKAPVLQGALKPTPGSLDIAGQPVVAFTGIGNPDRFFATLQAEGARLRVALPYPDHHPYSNDDAERILKAAAIENAIIATTQKDKVRLIGAPAGSPRDKLAAASITVPVRFEFAGSDAARLDAMLEMLLRKQ